MTYLVDRDHDVFISYAYGDDEPYYWVKDFVKLLQTELRRQLRIKEKGKEVDVTVWKDKELPQQAILSGRLKREIKESCRNFAMTFQISSTVSSTYLTIMI